MNTTELTYKNVARQMNERLTIKDKTGNLDLTGISNFDTFSNVYITCLYQDVLMRVSSLNIQTTGDKSAQDFIGIHLEHGADSIKLNSTSRIHTRKTDVSEIQERIQNVILEHRVAVDLEAVNEHIPEVLHNAKVHPFEQFYFLRCGFSKTEGFFDIAIGDFGYGIRGTLKQKSEYSYLASKPHMYSIEKSFIPKVTSKNEARGMGLSELHDYFLEQSKGVLFLSSGDGYYLIENDLEKHSVTSGNLEYNLNGVQILLRFFCSE